MSETPDIVSRLEEAEHQIERIFADVDVFELISDASAEITRLRAALAEIELRTRAYRDDDSWPLVSGIHHVASSALPSPPEDS